MAGDAPGLEELEDATGYGKTRRRRTVPGRIGPGDGPCGSWRACLRPWHEVSETGRRADQLPEVDRDGHLAEG